MLSTFVPAIRGPAYLIQGVFTARRHKTCVIYSTNWSSGMLQQGRRISLSLDLLVWSRATLL
ncbi:hypothetical protein BKA67DRAFT_543550 [Truncatella angustata]|uniref:Uncharacterized protein n=1 Tax=Truncatella angustata TaxID=152316 RepID=A0A9P8UV63_9PEZI|nr:uncharacterized protein BKA67DRAFT_543550 [Truncatella angustata]KAH6659096.1 hypothetical protein BKA67DRAFT_543550 [Truncatella angustata]